MQSGQKIDSARPLPRVVVVGLASCFGCQLQVSNAEAHLVEVLGQIDLGYWQLASSAPMPEEFDVAVIEGAVTTREAEQTVIELRRRADKVIAIGACATTAGIPGMAAPGFDARSQEVYPDGVPAACGSLVAPRPVSDIVKVDFEVRCCPIDSYDFIDALQCVLGGSNRSIPTKTLCGECKLNDRGCFFGRGQLCMGLVTRAGCQARCTSLGRPCNGCAGLSPDANLSSARRICEANGIPVERFNQALEMFNQVNPAVNPIEQG